VTAPKVPLPRSVLFCALLSLFLGTCTGMTSTGEAIALSQDSVATRVAEPDASPEEVRLGEAITGFQEARLRAIRPFRTWKQLTLWGLSLASMLTMVTALRVLVPAGLPRAALVRGLSTAAIGAAVLRTVDGAMEFVLARRLALPMSEVWQAQMALQLAGQDAQTMALAEQMKAQLPGAYSGFTAVLTLVVAGSFLAVGQYLGSERIRAAFAPATPQ